MKIGILGFGHVASATVQAMMSNRELIALKTNTTLDLVKLATRTVARTANRVPPGCEVIEDCWAVVNDPEIDTVIELIGGTMLTKELVMRALANGKHVITANKALLAYCGEEIMALADQHGVCVLFEAAVAVSIPIIKTLKSSAAANHLTSVVGILNGTSNYILSQMSEHGTEFNDALAQAQEKGFAEADPTLDINGEDAAHKITLLASLAFGIPIRFDTTCFKGISSVERVDAQFAKRLGYELKLIAQARLEHNKAYVAVAPMLVPQTELLAQVHGSMNGISMAGDLFGSAFFYGSGAGGRQTASAILADLIELAQQTQTGRHVGTPNLGFKKSALRNIEHQPPHERSSQFYLRLRVEDKVGVLAEVSTIFANAEVSLSTLLQDESEHSLADLVATTHATSWAQLQDILPALQQASAVSQPVIVYPILEEHPA